MILKLLGFSKDVRVLVDFEPQRGLWKTLVLILVQSNFMISSHDQKIDEGHEYNFHE